VSGPIRRLALASATLVLCGCPKELPPDTPAEELYRIGVEKFERRDWTRAIEALQRFLFQDPGHQNADSAQYLIGESYFQQRQYLTAAAEFLRLAQNRPAGQLADDARYRACQCYYELSPRPELDQEYTEEAIDQCQSVVLLYPQSPLAQEAAQRARELADKLARKHYLNAEYYYKRRAYDSAIIYLKHVIAAYPGSTVEPDALLTLYETYSRLGYFEEAEATKDRLMQNYPESTQAEKVRRRSSD
jgi:outer membrane protein assembly factor BamD